MNAQHRRPLVACVLVTLCCLWLIGHAAHAEARGVAPLASAVVLAAYLGR